MILQILMLITIAALIVLVDWQDNRYNNAVQNCRRNHPTNWPSTSADDYDWSKEDGISNQGL